MPQHPGKKKEKKKEIKPVVIPKMEVDVQPLAEGTKELLEKLKKERKIRDESSNNQRNR